VQQVPQFSDSVCLVNAVEEKQKRIEFLEKKVQTEDEVLAELMAEHIALKKSLGTLTGGWVPHDVRDQ